MKRDMIIVLKVILLVGLSFGIAYTILYEYYFSAVILSAVLCLITLTLISYQQRLVRKMENMISRIEYGDMNIHFPEDASGIYGTLNRSMNKALSAFRLRLYNAIVSEAEVEAWQKLIRVLAHEIMNSLAPIISLSETMSERGEKENPSTKEYSIMLAAMQSIHRRSTGLLQFVENYRLLTRIPEPVRQYFHIHDLFRNLQQLMDKDEKYIAFSILPENLKLYADQSQIEQIILNLLKNALEASQGRPDIHILVKAYTEDDKIFIRVKDNGPGIIPESLDKIFVPFYTTKQTGSGIGLSFSRQVMNRHNGTIQVESELDKETSFTLVFN